MIYGVISIGCETWSKAMRLSISVSRAQRSTLWCAADPGSSQARMFQEPSLRRPRISGAPLRFAARCTASGERQSVCFPGAGQPPSAFPGRSAARSGALPTRDRPRLECFRSRACADPGSAVHRCALHRVRGTSECLLPGRSAARSGALPTRDRPRLECFRSRACADPGSAVHRCASLRAAPRPGNEVYESETSPATRRAADRPRSRAADCSQ